MGVYKPAASGCRRESGELVSDDALALWQAAGRPGELAAVCPQRFAAPLAPHLAAEAEGRTIDERSAAVGPRLLAGRSDVVLVEGAGGLLSPLSPQQYVADVAHDLGLPLVVVARNRIGVINQALQTLAVAATFRQGLPVAGVVLCDTEPAECTTRAGHRTRGSWPGACPVRVFAQRRLSAHAFRAGGRLAEPVPVGRRQ